jgi:hypothetical protein
MFDLLGRASDAEGNWYQSKQSHLVSSSIPIFHKAIHFKPIRPRFQKVAKKEQFQLEFQ